MKIKSNTDIIHKNDKNAISGGWIYFRIFLYFLLGNIAGCAISVVVLGSPESTYEIAYRLSPKLIVGLLVLIYFLIFFIGSSFLGWLITPLLLSLSGCFTAIASATIILNNPTYGVLISLISFAIPVLFIFPVLFFMANRSIVSSKKLLQIACSIDSSGKIVFLDIKFFLFTLAVLIIGILLQVKLIPIIISRIT